MIRGGVILSMGCVLLVFPAIIHGQDAREYIRKGNKLYGKKEFSGGEVMYRRAQGQEKSTPDAGFNLGDALYKQGKFSEAAGEYDKTLNAYTAEDKLAESYYNLGNARLKEQKYKESIDAYISSLKLKPDNKEAKYNLAYAQDKLKKQEEQQKQQQQQDKKQDEKKSDEKKDDEKKDNGQDQQNQQQQRQNGADQQNGTMSREDAKRLLDALAASEKNTQEKVQRDKAARAKARVIKNW